MMRRRIKKALVYIVAVTMLISSASFEYVYADEPVTVDTPADEVGENEGGDGTQLGIDTSLPVLTEATEPKEPDDPELEEGNDTGDDEGEPVVETPVEPENKVNAEEPVVEGGTEEEPEKAGKVTTEADPDAVTAIGPYANDRIDMEFKPALDIVLMELPEMIVIYKGEDRQEISVEWECADDYNELLGNYRFVPILTDYKLADDLEIPAITVRIENEESGPVGGTLEYDPGIEVPVVGNGALRLRGGSLPASYNKYTDGTLPRGVPDVRRQNPYGTCWAFASIGAMETDLIHDGGGKDLSELHMAYYASHEYNDPKGCRSDSTWWSSSNGAGWLNNGGHILAGLRLLSNMVGAVDESDVKYSSVSSNPGTYSLDDSYVTSKDSVRIRNAYIIDVVNDRTGVKNAIREHGGVATSYFDDNAGYNGTHNSYCYNTSTYNHAVMIVGWDDDFSKSKFNYTPSGDGAWLVRNSWGYNGYGHSGYFWLSYYDPGLTAFGEAIAYDVSTDVFDNCYAYDGQPLESMYSSFSSGVSVVTKYDVDAGETIRAVGFETADANLSAEVTVKNLTSGQSVTKTVGTSFAGFYTAEFNNTLDFPVDSEAEVTIRYTAPGNGQVTLVVESPTYIGYWGCVYYTGRLDKGCTVNGRSVEYDPRIKLYTDDATFSTSDNVKLEESSFSGHWEDTAQIRFATDSNVQNMSLVTWTSMNTNVATVSPSGLITFGAKKGTAKIKGEYTSGGQTETVWVSATVQPYNVTYHITSDTVTTGMRGTYNASARTFTGEFYPGDSADSTLFNAMRKSGYYVTAWYSNSSCYERYKVGWNPTDKRDLELWPKWGQLTMSVKYYAPYSSFTGYDPYTRHTIRNNILADQLPYTLPDATGCSENPNNYAVSYNNSHYYQKVFSYWSSDAAGRYRVTSVTSSAFNVRYEGGVYKANTDITLYPQYRDVAPAAPPAVNVYYRTHVQNVGWQGFVSNGAVAGTTGRSLRLEGINIYLSGNPNLGVQYVTHCQDYGWLTWSSNGEMNGTTGEAKRLEAIMINLTGPDKDRYDIYYRVHAQDVGWMGWAMNGQAAGTAGFGRRLEGIQIVVTQKGAGISSRVAGITSVTSSRYISTSGVTPSVPNAGVPNVSYRTHVENVGWQGWRTNGQFAGTSGRALRLEGININLSNKQYSGGICYKTHVQNIGWQGWRYDGEMSGTSGRALRLEAINIELYGDMARYYDVYYRVHAQDVGWMGWAKNGQSAGTAGYARRLEGIQILVLPKGSGAPAWNYGGITQNTSLPFVSR